MRLNATDADEPNNLNSKIAFKITSQEPSDSPMFIINRYTGEIRTMNNFLDREVISFSVNVFVVSLIGTDFKSRTT